MGRDWDRIKKEYKPGTWNFEADENGQGDIAIVFQFMKMLDPGSVVREGEFKTAAGAGPRAVAFARWWNGMWSGGRFTNADRHGFLRTAKRVHKSAFDEYYDLRGRYAAKLRTMGFDPRFILGDEMSYLDQPGVKRDRKIEDLMRSTGYDRDKASRIVDNASDKAIKIREGLSKRYSSTGL